VKKPRFGGMGGQDGGIYASLDDFKKVNQPLKIDQKYVYERLIYGREIAVDAIWDGNSIVFLNIGWTLFDPELDIIVGSTSQSDNILSNLESRIKEVLCKFCSLLQLGPEVLNADIMLDSKNSLHIIEVEFVPADGIPLCKEAFGYDLVKNYVSTYLGDKIQARSKRKKNVALIYSTKSKLKSMDRIDSKSAFSIGDFHPIKPYQIQTKKGLVTINGYYLISNDDSDQLISYIKNTFQKISLRRYDHD